MTTEKKVRPLQRVDRGEWRSRDRPWTFIRHHDGRWFVYLNDDDHPFYFEGFTTLREAVRRAQLADQLG